MENPQFDFPLPEADVAIQASAPATGFENFCSLMSQDISAEVFRDFFFPRNSRGKIMIARATEKRITGMGRLIIAHTSPRTIKRDCRRDFSMMGPKTRARISGAISNFNFLKKYPTSPMPTRM